MTGSDVELLARIERLEKEVAQLTGVLDEIIAKNMPINALLYFNDDKNVSSRSFKLQFDENLDLPNTHSAESWNGKVFRWLGPNPSTTLSIPRDRSVGYDLRITVPHYTGGDNALAGTTILVDGDNIASQIVTEGNDKIITAVIPPLAAAVYFPAFLLTINYPKAWQMREPSARVVTLAVSQIMITPRR